MAMMRERLAVWWLIVRAAGVSWKNESRLRASGGFSLF
jgi:hypothetical protein